MTLIFFFTGYNLQEAQSYFKWGTCFNKLRHVTMSTNFCYNIGCPEKMCHSFCLNSLATNMLEGWEYKNFSVRYQKPR